VPRVLFQALLAATDQLSAGFMICDADGRLLHANSAAQEMMDNGWPIRSHNGSLRASDSSRTDALLKALRQVVSEALLLDPASVSVDLPLASSQSQRGVAIVTLRPLPVQRDCLIALYVTIPLRGEDAEICGFAECFDLTPAEVRTLAQLVRGHSVAEAAQRLAISQNTVKTHLRSIFLKTGSSRQQQLMGLVADLTPPLRRARRAAKLDHPYRGAAEKRQKARATAQPDASLF
jgi:DNA-binding CsgD family transcriptional regulator